MNLAQFKQVATKTPYNTCNGWGFGGDSGNVYEYKNATFYDTKRYYRHSKPSDSKSYWVNNKEVTKKEFETTLNTLI